MAKRSVTITAAWIGGTCIIVAAVVAGVFQLLSAPDAATPIGTEPDDPAQAALGATASTRSYEDLNRRPLDSLTFSEYYKRFEDLDDRNLERQEFVRSMVGTRVVWQGYVVKVYDEGESVILVIKPSPDRIVELASVRFPAADWRTDLFALRNGDHVEVVAIYSGNTHAIVHLQGHSVSRIE